jgi:hypothetical protein
MRNAATGSGSAQQILIGRCKTGTDRRRIFYNSCSSEEIAMISSRKSRHLARLVFATSNVALLWAGPALASQGPGSGRGTASSLTQLAMAIIVYGASAMIVGAGLIGAALIKNQPRRQ